jgi:predicted ATP-dependent serine protease
MICSNCGHEHENVRGRCPKCAEHRSLSKRQKERPAEMLGSEFVCTTCGKELTFAKVIKDGREVDVRVHVSSGTHACPNSK